MNGVQMMIDVWSRVDGPMTVLAVGLLALSAGISGLGLILDEEHRARWAFPLGLILAGVGGFLASIFLVEPGALAFDGLLPELATLVAFAGVPATVFVLVTSGSVYLLRSVRDVLAEHGQVRAHAS
ncbi:hypothetical protein HT102_11395 [Hoyosella sp. G463]|uniref:Uncharacterized protein n=1 Tax=Lolliginicoccus lacisalsi TaxID=2742202 RepID=A0A927PLQ3_9ACTN|nr:hypothetical protein [Lolliginicoccus lacisalsi]MBD8507093.1 hypothetical protein [Lolliginicoccus lacisalsi]